MCYNLSMKNTKATVVCGLVGLSLAGLVNPTLGVGLLVGVPVVALGCLAVAGLVKLLGI